MFPLTTGDTVRLWRIIRYSKAIFVPGGHCCEEVWLYIFAVSHLLGSVSEFAQARVQSSALTGMLTLHELSHLTRESNGETYSTMSLWPYYAHARLTMSLEKTTWLWRSFFHICCACVTYRLSSQMTLWDKRDVRSGKWKNVSEIGASVITGFHFGGFSFCGTLHPFAETWHTYFRKWVHVLRMCVHACNILYWEWQAHWNSHRATFLSS